MATRLPPLLDFCVHDTRTGHVKVPDKNVHKDSAGVFPDKREQLRSLVSPWRPNTTTVAHAARWCPKAKDGQGEARGDEAKGRGTPEN